MGFLNSLLSDRPNQYIVMQPHMRSCHNVLRMVLARPQVCLTCHVISYASQQE